MMLHMMGGRIMIPMNGRVKLIMSGTKIVVIDLIPEHDWVSLFIEMRMKYSKKIKDTVLQGSVWIVWPKHD